MLRGISPTAQDKFVKLPARQSEAVAAPSVEASFPPVPLPESGPQPEPWLLSTILTIGQGYAVGCDFYRPKIYLQNIINEVTRFYKISRTDLMSNKRSRYIVRPRQICMYLGKTLTSHSYPEIGRRFGNKDHTTVLHACRKIEQLMFDDEEIAGDVASIKARIAR